MSAADYVFVAGAGTLTVVPSVHSPIIGGFNSTRAGGLGVSDGSSLNSFRANLAGSLPLATVAGTATLTDTFFDGIDVALLSSPSSSSSAVSPLTWNEQEALQRFVLSGGGAVVLVDSDAFAGGASSAANNSFLAPFGMHVTGTDCGANATFANPSASAVTSGPFGTLSTATIVCAGWFDTLGPATAYGTLTTNGQPFLAVIPPGALAPGSGPVVLLSSEDIETDL